MASSSVATNELSNNANSSSNGSKVHLKIMSPSSGVPTDLAYHVDPTTTINTLKGMITESLQSKPPSQQQRLIYRGKILEGASTIGNALVGQDEEAYTLHLVISPPASTSPALPADPTPATNPTTATFRPEFRFGSLSPASRQPGFTTTTVHTTTSIITPRGARNPFNSLNPSGPSGVGLTGVSSSSRGEASLERLQQELRTQRETLDRLRRAHREAADMASSTSANLGTSTGVSLPGLGTDARSRLSPPSFSAIPGEQANAFAYPSSLFSSQPSSAASASSSSSLLPPPNLPTPEQTITQNLEYIEALRRGENTIFDIPAFPRNDEAAARRRALQDSLREMEQEEAGLFPGLESIATPTGTQPLTFTRQALPENSLVYLLQDQFGRPHSLLIGPPGSALQNSSIYDLPPAFQYHGHNNFYNPMVPGLPLPTGFPSPHAMPQMNQYPGAHWRPQPPAAGQPAAAPNRLPQHDIEAVQRELLAMNPQVQFRQINIPRLMRDRAGHLWLALKLAVFVVLFTGNGGWRRTLCLGLIAVVIFVWQTGLLNGIVRPFIEALYPTPPPQQQQPPAPGQQQQQEQQPLDPAQTAQMLVNRQEDRVREAIRNAERAFMIFMASLVPGWHDRHVNAIEQQQQQAREAAQQRQQQGDEPQPAEARGAEVVEGVL